MSIQTRPIAKELLVSIITVSVLFYLYQHAALADASDRLAGGGKAVKAAKAPLQSGLARLLQHLSRGQPVFSGSNAGSSTCEQLTFRKELPGRATDRNIPKGALVRRECKGSYQEYLTFDPSLSNILWTENPDHECPLDKGDGMFALGCCRLDRYVFASEDKDSILLRSDGKDSDEIRFYYQKKVCLAARTKTVQENQIPASSK